jgi:serine/threonine protein phosphatase PrpC
VNQLIEAGQLTEEEAETFEHNNIILQALGTSDTVQVDLTFAEVRKGDILLLCSDGLSGMVRFEDIRETLRSGMEPLDICKSLTERANAAGGHDNITVIIVQFDGPNLKEVGDEGDPLKYRKYVLTDERDEEKTASNMTAPTASPGTAAAAPEAVRTASNPPQPWQERSPGDHDYDRVDIPGTAFLLLRP